MKRLYFFVCLVLILPCFPAISHAITIEEFIQKHPDAVVALSAVYYTNGPDKPSTWSTGFTADDPYALNGSNLISVKELYNSGIVPTKVWSDLISKSDNSIDLLNVSTKDSRKYADNFAKEEMVLIQEQTGYKIIDKIFGTYDSNTIPQIKKELPDFYMQLSSKKQLYLDKEADVNKRLNDIDPTPPLY